MAAHRKLVRDAMRAVLADGDSGFNASLAAVQGDYGIIGDNGIDWLPGSESVFLGRVDAAVSPLRGELKLTIYTGPSRWTGETKGVKWTGAVTGLLLFEVTFSAELGADSDEIDDSMAEPWAEAIEDAVTEVFGRRSIDWGALGVVYTKPPDCPNPQDTDALAAGWHRVIPIEIGFKVDVNY